MGNSNELYWAAGFFDGEGCISCSNCKGWGYLRFSITQKDLRPLYRFSEALGKSFKTYKSKRSGVTEYCIYRQEEVADALSILWPYLSEPKKEQALRAYDKKDNMREEVSVYE